MSHRPRSAALAGAFAAALLTGSCDDRVRHHDGGPPPRLLSEWRLFEQPMRDLLPRGGALAYSVNTELFSDYSEKLRFVWMPAGTAAEYRDDVAFELPVGSILVKTFAYPEDPDRPDGDRRLIETRLLVRTAETWLALPYVWNDEQTDAELKVGGARRTVVMAEPDGAHRTIDHMVPNTNMCAQCHTEPGHFAPLGIKARHLNRDFAYPDGVENQLTRWRRAGYLTGGPSPEDAPRTPPFDDPAAGTVAARARGWLDVNCGSCHSPAGKAGTSGMYLGVEIDDPLRLGIGKPPVAAGQGSGGRKFGIVPGEPDQSILLHRIESTEPGVAMPELGRQLVPREAVALLREWIAGM